MIAPIALENIKLARGSLVMICTGMIGSGTRDSTKMKSGKQTPKIIRETITKGWDQE